MLPDSGTLERRDLESEALHVAVEMLDRTFNEVGAAIHQTFMQFRSRFIVERGLDEASDQGQAWADAVTGARQLTAFVNDVIAVSIRGRFATD